MTYSKMPEVIALLSTTACTSAEIAERLPCNQDTSYRCVNHLKAVGMLYVAEWTLKWNQHAPRYRLQPSPNAIADKPKPKAKRPKASRPRITRPPNSVFQLAAIPDHGGNHWPHAGRN